MFNDTNEMDSNPLVATAERTPVGAPPEYHHDPSVAKQLYKLGLLDSPPEEAFDKVTRLAKNLFEVPFALMSILDSDRQFFKSAAGLEAAAIRQTPLSHSFCKHVVASGKPLIINDAREHAWVAENPAIKELGVIAYVGIPISLGSGEPVGSFCLVDHKPRVWTEREITLLKHLTDAVITQIEYRARNQQLEEVRQLATQLPTVLDELRDSLAGLVSRLDEDQNADVKRFVIRSEDRIRQLTRLENELTNELKQAQPTDHKEWVDLTQLVREVVQVPETWAPAVHIDTRIDSGPLLLNCDTSNLKGGLDRILHDAVTFARSSVIVDVQPLGTEALVRIESVGSGIPASTLIKTLTQFSTIPLAVAGETQTQGLSVRMSGNEMQIDGACVRARTSMGEKTVIEIRLPICELPTINDLSDLVESPSLLARSN